MEFALPITVISAILLFVIKEVLELFRKSKAKKRKLSALKSVLKEELELNLWVWKKFESLLTNVKVAEVGSTYEYLVSPSGAERFELLSPDGHGQGQSFPKVVIEMHSKLVIEVAEIDADMYQKLIGSYKALSELQHLRNGIVDFIHESRMGEHYVEGFTGYALEELAPIYDELNALYRYCTGKALTEHRMR
ncbi:hypothetical protein CWO33_13655 [Vibrio splendidus]|uniref:hypothetical protein n=1 Tax=Vibrio splendidus TaxID=29497 RepID=UPI000D3860CC|nr:hypothetical protein [Vibrio splendidus]PTQ14261.1 hypothetical protein CWO33_13655 [Vibrio splendidus]